MNGTIPPFIWRFVLLLVAMPSFPALAQETGNDFAEIMALASWDSAKFSEFEQDEPLSEAETQRLLPLLKRLKSFDDLSIARWTTFDTTAVDILAQPADFQTQLVHMQGKLTRVERHLLSDEDAERLEFSSVAWCQVVLSDGTTRATVLTADVPDDWTSNTTDEPISFAGLVIKRTPLVGDDLGLVFVAPRLAWHPTTTGRANQSFGRAVLGGLGFDVGLLDDVQNHSQIRSQEREAFYQMLSATGRIGSNQLIRSAQRELAKVAEKWQAEINMPPPRGLMAQEVVRQAGDGLYSVAPLFNDAANQIGNLVTLEGVVRRAVRIEVGTLPNGQPSDVSRRFGIDHYFELDLFTADSQDHPIVYCTLELPDGFSVGSKLHEPVQLAGFFFKSWRHHTRQSVGSASASRQQLAPLLVGPMPLRFEPATNPSRKFYSIGASVVFVLAILGVWLAARWTSRGDAQFSKRNQAAEPNFVDWDS